MYIGNVDIDLQYCDDELVLDEQHIEENLYAKLKEGDAEEDILAADSRYAILKALSPNRRNLLEWFPFDPEASLLEIGAGCGAMTGLFTERVGEVCSIVPTQIRAKITAVRNRTADNLKVIVGKMERICLEEKFDYITLIGSLEEAPLYITAADPYQALLEECLRHLKPGGTLIIAVENRFGLKYWAGAREPKTKMLFAGIEAPLLRKDCRAFAKQELKDLLAEVGIKDCTLRYPFPDYHFAQAVYSDERLPQGNELVDKFPNYHSDRLDLFDEGQVLEAVLKNKCFDVFSNSFLVTCRCGR